MPVCSVFCSVSGWWEKYLSKRIPLKHTCSWRDKVAVPLAKKNILAPLGITAAASAIDAGIQKKIHGSGTTTLIISNEEMNDIMKIFQAL